MVTKSSLVRLVFISSVVAVCTGCPPGAPDVDPGDVLEGGNGSTGTVSAVGGDACGCDDDCPSVGAHDGICVSGICAMTASATCGSAGSTTECPSGSRCWENSGLSVCYPACSSVTCEGTCDSDGSCVATGSQSCYASCGAICGDDDPGSGPCGTAVEAAQRDLVNLDRERYDLDPLACHSGLTAVARAHSKDMHDRQFFSHTNFEGQSPFDRMTAAGIDYRGAAENIAHGQTTAAQVEEDWMNSPGHRANILNGDLTHIGVGVWDGPDGIFWTQNFARF